MTVPHLKVTKAPRGQTQKYNTVVMTLKLVFCDIYLLKFNTSTI